MKEEGSREAFEAHFPHLSLAKEPDAWGNPTYRHSHVQALWDGWQAASGLRGFRSAQALAERFHEAYERLAPSFGYETRPETRVLDLQSANGRLMVAVCQEILAALHSLSGGGAHLRAPATLPESMSRDEMLKYYSEYANMVAHEVMNYQRRIRELEAASPLPPQAGQGVRMLTSFEVLMVKQQNLKNGFLLEWQFCQALQRKFCEVNGLPAPIDSHQLKEGGNGE